MRIVFMGTPAFAVPPLAALWAAGDFEIVAVCTQPDRPKGRGHQVVMSPVKEWAVAHGVPALQFERLRRKEGVEALRLLNADFFVTAAFGQILSQRLLDIPKRGTVNLHASLLPKHRGAAPINWCLIQGETETGMTTMMTDAGIDTGDMLLTAQTAILPDETAGELTERLSQLGAPLLVETLRRLVRGDCPREKQDEALATHEPMFEKAHGRIDWAKDTREIVGIVRGVDPWPGAYTEMGEETLKVWRARAVPEMATAGVAPGQILVADAKAGLIVACQGGAVEIVELQMPNAKRMSAKDYLRGHPMLTGQCLGKVML